MDFQFGKFSAMVFACIKITVNTQYHTVHMSCAFMQQKSKIANKKANLLKVG